MNRRQFLAAGTAVGLAGIVAITGPARSWLLQRRVRSNLIRFAGGAEHAATVGRVYLQQAPQERSAEVLIERLSADLGVNVDALTDTAVYPAMADAIRGDFERARVVELDGWILSMTEARIAAVCAL